MTFFLTNGLLTLLGQAIGQRIKAANTDHRLIECHGRGYCYDNARWCTSADDNYGPNYYQFNENSLLNTDPAQEWEHNGHIIREGETIKDVVLRGRVTDRLSIADIDYMFTYTNSLGRWYGSGIDNDGEDEHVELYRGLWKGGDGANQSAKTFNIDDKFARKIDLGDFVAPADGELRFYFRPINVDPRPNTTTDYWQVGYQIKVGLA